MRISPSLAPLLFWVSARSLAWPASAAREVHPQTSRYPSLKTAPIGEAPLSTTSTTSGADRRWSHGGEYPPAIGLFAPQLAPALVSVKLSPSTAPGAGLLAELLAEGWQRPTERRCLLICTSMLALPPFLGAAAGSRIARSTRRLKSHPQMVMATVSEAAMRRRSSYALVCWAALC